MNRIEWIAACAAAFERAGHHAYPARELAIVEFNIRCRHEPLDSSPELSSDRWTDPAEAAAAALEEVSWRNDGD